MVRWDALNKPKDFGWLAFIDTRAMNVCHSRGGLLELKVEKKVHVPIC